MKGLPETGGFVLVKFDSGHFTSANEYLEDSAFRLNLENVNRGRPRTLGWLSDGTWFNFLSYYFF